MEKYNFDTGDIILFGTKYSNSFMFIINYLIEYFTNSSYSHCGMIVKNPLIDNKIIEGLYFLESTGFTHKKDIADNKEKFGVQLVPLIDRLQTCKESCYYRKLNCVRDTSFNNLFNKAYSMVKNKPYDLNPEDWYKAEFNIAAGNTQDTNEYFCSALVTFLLVTLEIIPKSIPWTLMRPKDLGTEQGHRINITNLEKEIKLEL